jgi:hypothetical protein
MNPPHHLLDSTRAHTGHSHADHDHAEHSSDRHASTPATVSPVTSVLGWPAWQRVLALLPLLLLMWLAVWWASAEVTPW